MIRAVAEIAEKIRFDSCSDEERLCYANCVESRHRPYIKTQRACGQHQIGTLERSVAKGVFTICCGCTLIRCDNTTPTIRSSNERLSIRALARIGSARSAEAVRLGPMIYTYLSLHSSISHAPMEQRVHPSTTSLRCAQRSPRCPAHRRCTSSQVHSGPCAAAARSASLPGCVHRSRRSDGRARFPSR
ncbi:hypothetical protein P3T23_006082 [Paraburkholderia sp. GAS448]